MVRPRFLQQSGVHGLGPRSSAGLTAPHYVAQTEPDRDRSGSHSLIGPGSAARLDDLVAGSVGLAVQPSEPYQGAPAEARPLADWASVLGWV